MKAATKARTSIAGRGPKSKVSKGCRVPLHGFIVEVLSGIAAARREDPRAEGSRGGRLGNDEAGQD